MQAAILKRLNKEEKGFTLIELLAVIVILAVIAAIAIPLISGIINKSKSDSDVATARQIYDAAKLYVISELNGAYPTDTAGVTVAKLQEKKFLDPNLVLPSTKEKLPSDSKVVFANADGALETVTIGSKTYSSKEILEGKASPTPPASNS